MKIFRKIVLVITLLVLAALCFFCLCLLLRQLTHLAAERNPYNPEDEPDYPYTLAVGDCYRAAVDMDLPDGADMVTYDTDYEILEPGAVFELEGLVWLNEGAPDLLVRIGNLGISAPSSGSDIKDAGESDNCYLVFLYSMEQSRVLAYSLVYK